MAFLACAALFAFRGRRLTALAAAVAALLPIAQVAPWYFGRESQSVVTSGPPLKLLVSNVYFGNRQYERIQRVIAQEDPDVVGLVEINQRWQQELGDLRMRYPHHFELPDERFVGLGLYSRLPIENARAIRVPGGSTPAIAATLKTPAGDIEILIVHVVPPMSAQLIRRRNEQILGLAQYARSVTRPLVMAGDFNITMWNAGYRPLEEIGGLQNARKGIGVRPTWPAIGTLGVPIDHVLATPEVAIREFRALSGIGSDHRPVSAMLSVRDPR